MRVLAYILLISVALSSCTSQYPDGEEVKQDYYDTVAANFSDGLGFAAITIQCRPESIDTVVTGDMEAYRLLCKSYSSETSCTKAIANSMRNNKAIEVSESVAYTLLQEGWIHWVEVNKDGHASALQTLQQYFVYNPRNRVWFACASEQKDRDMAIYLLIKSWHCYVSRDDESGCAVVHYDH
ncbi:MAG: hypothetical protein EOP51_01270 [Sphingobacteriales bacterium]|nr:MAG: hypothetical protein EOP51_01270 [Sphingobacteriales bacterium]